MHELIDLDGVIREFLIRTRLIDGNLIFAGYFAAALRASLDIYWQKNNFTSRQWVSPTPTILHRMLLGILEEKHRSSTDRQVFGELMEPKSLAVREKLRVNGREVHAWNLGEIVLELAWWTSTDEWFLFSSRSNSRNSPVLILSPVESNPGQPNST